MQNQFYEQKLRSDVFEPVFGGLRGNVSTSSIPGWNTRKRGQRYGGKHFTTFDILQLRN